MFHVKHYYTQFTGYTNPHSYSHNCWQFCCLHPYNVDNYLFRNYSLTVKTATKALYIVFVSIFYSLYSGFSSFVMFTPTFDILLFIFTFSCVLYKAKLCYVNHLVPLFIPFRSITYSLSFNISGMNVVKSCKKMIIEIKRKLCYSVCQSRFQICRRTYRVVLAESPSYFYHHILCFKFNFLYLGRG